MRRTNPCTVHEDCRQSPMMAKACFWFAVREKMIAAIRDAEAKHGPILVIDSIANLPLP